MYQVLDNGIITLSRGDTFNYVFSLKDDIKGKPIELTEDDTIYFGICEPNQLWENAIVRKICEKLIVDNEYTGEYKISLESIDTEYLYPGKYYYSIKLRQIDENDNEIVTTIKEKTLFWIE